MSELKPCCGTCGFPLDMPRVPVFLDNNALSYISATENMCKECGHQKDGWTIKPVHEHMVELRRRWDAKHKLTLTILEDVLFQACNTVNGRADSGALTAYAIGLKHLADNGRFKIERQHGRMIVGRFKEE